MESNQSQQDICHLIGQVTGAVTVEKESCLQMLWEGYGHITRYRLSGCERRSVILKQVRLSQLTDHPATLSHRRKLRSYEVESSWYQHYQPISLPMCHSPKLIASTRFNGDRILILEDLAEQGYRDFDRCFSRSGLLACLTWLAHFHACYLTQASEGLWEQGTYWHLSTRPNEWAALSDRDLKQGARAIAHQLSAAAYQTVVHGDAKQQNFAIHQVSGAAAALDFQYTGRGPGILDVAYLLDSCLSEPECLQQAESLLDHYFIHLEHAIQRLQKELDIASLIQEWRTLFPFAWMDFQRFWKGWSATSSTDGPFTLKQRQTVFDQI